MIDESGGAEQGQDIEINISMLYREFGTKSSLHFNYYLLIRFSSLSDKVEIWVIYSWRGRKKKRKKKDIKWLLAKVVVNIIHCLCGEGTLKKSLWIVFLSVIATLTGTSECCRL